MTKTIENENIVLDLPCVISYWEDGRRHGIFVKRGPAYATVITTDGLTGQAIHLRKFLRLREKGFKPVLFEGKPYPPERAAAHYIDSLLGVTGSAREILQTILDGKPATPENGHQEQATIGEDMTAVNIEVDKKDYKVVKAASGRKSLDRGDTAAKMLREKTLDECYEIVAKKLGESELSLKRKYGKLNPGMQRMNLGNRLRKALKAKE